MKSSMTISGKAGPGRIACGSARRASGFTLIELMIVAVIVAVILAVAVPGFSVLIERTRLKSYANELVSSMQLARGEAIKRNGIVVLCVSDDGDECTGGGDWEEGWIVLDPNERVLKQHQELASGLVLFELSSVSELSFDPSGVGSTSATFKLCQQAPSPGIEEKRISLSVTGRTRVETIKTGCP